MLGRKLPQRESLYARCLDLLLIQTKHFQLPASPQQRLSNDSLTFHLVSTLDPLQSNQLLKQLPWLFPPLLTPFILQYTHHLCVSKHYLLNVSRLCFAKGFPPTRRNFSMLGIHKNLSAYRDSIGFGVVVCKSSRANGTTMCHHRTLIVYSGSLTWKHGVLFIFHELSSQNYKLICSFQRLRTSSFNKSCPLVLSVLEPENSSYHCMQGYRILIVVRST